jgi:hypothetical protein
LDAGCRLSCGRCGQEKKCDAHWGIVSEFSGLRKLLTTEDTEDTPGRLSNQFTQMMKARSLMDADRGQLLGTEL